MTENKKPIILLFQYFNFYVLHTQILSLSFLWKLNGTSNIHIPKLWHITFVFHITVSYELGEVKNKDQQIYYHWKGLSKVPTIHDITFNLDKIYEVT